MTIEHFIIPRKLDVGNVKYQQKEWNEAAFDNCTTCTKHNATIGPTRKRRDGCAHTAHNKKELHNEKATTRDLRYVTCLHFSSIAALFVQNLHGTQQCITKQSK